MPTSQATLILREVKIAKPISEKTRAFQRRRLQNRFHRFIMKMFKEQQKEEGLTQKELAERIDSRPEQVNRWLSIPGNLTLNTVSDLLLGMGVDLDDPSATPLAILAEEAASVTKAASARKARYSSIDLTADRARSLWWMINPRPEQILGRERERDNELYIRDAERESRSLQDMFRLEWLDQSPSPSGEGS